MNWPAIVLVAAWPPVWGRLACRLGFSADWKLQWAITAGALVIVDLIFRDWPTTLVAAASCAIALAWWWWDKRRRDRAKAWLGAKSKALRDALVRKAREAAKPRPVLRPVPGGARCT